MIVKKLTVLLAACCLCISSSACSYVKTIQDNFKSAQQLQEVGSGAAGMAGGAWNAVTGWCRNSTGEIIGACCKEACMKSENADDFQRKFIQQVNNQISDQAIRDRVWTVITFEKSEAPACNGGDVIQYTRTDHAGGTSIEDTQGLSEGALGENPTGADAEARAEFVSTLATVIDNALQNGSSTTLKITLLTCPKKQTPPQTGDLVPCRDDATGNTDDDPQSEDEKPKSHHSESSEYGLGLLESELGLEFDGALAAERTPGGICYEIVDECCTVGPDKDEEVEMDDDLLDEVRRELDNRRRRP